MPNGARLIYAAAGMRTGTPTTKRNSWKGVPRGSQLIPAGMEARTRTARALLVGAPAEGGPQRPTTRRQGISPNSRIGAGSGKGGLLLGPGGAGSQGVRAPNVGPNLYAARGNASPGDKDRPTAPECRRRLRRRCSQPLPWPPTRLTDPSHLWDSGSSPSPKASPWGNLRAP